MRKRAVASFAATGHEPAQHGLLQPVVASTLHIVRQRLSCSAPPQVATLAPALTVCRRTGSHFHDRADAGRRMRAADGAPVPRDLVP
eukprot:CAMPEP_0170281038 /NCGR_PEP_ID=MMETSP0116_2-20130129/40538_1 /TAXON_ID=400756 /ORGANISM="Durinskia baltica, Strain CSIRO CS-38" /LENGTH=86 /DNA_ID=CAMNT_0010532379 /DNA_START=209 /DNA_END=466 /DNA_ORIENTATION=-